MASAQFASSCIRPSTSLNSLVTRKTTTCLSPSFSSNFTKRKNHLRPKLLKTLTKPYSPPPLNPPQEYINESLQSPQEQELLIDSDNNLGELELENVQVPATPEPEFVLTTRSVIELVVYIVGFVIIQTIINLWVMRSIEEDKLSKNEEKVTTLGFNGKKKEGFWFDRHKQVKPETYINLDESEMKGQIVEIRAMAKEVRELEARKLRNSSSLSSDVIEFDEEDVIVRKPVVMKVKTGIQKEVDVKLSKLDKRLRSTREKSLALKVSNLNNFDEVKDKKDMQHSGVKDKDENLMFKKKLKFKSDSSSREDSPKGFQSDYDHKVINGNKKTSASSNTADKTRNHIQNNSSGKELESKEASGAKTRKKIKVSEKEEAIKVEKTKPEFGSVQSNNVDSEKPEDPSKRNTNSSPSLNKRADKQVSRESDMWWLNLPYALAILLRRNSETEGPGGFYSLKMEDGSPSYFVAFEDNRDASNFCVILDVFFEELEDLSADVVPLSIKELKAEVEASGLKVIVVKKGQLRLYAGQPLAEVEMILRSLVK